MSTDQIQSKYLDTYSRSTFFIGGQWVKPHSKKMIEVISPSTEQLLGRVPDADAKDINDAVLAAKSAFEKKGGWSSWSIKQRTEVMRRFAQILEAKQGISMHYMTDEHSQVHKLKENYNPKRIIAIVEHQNTKEEENAKKAITAFAEKEKKAIEENPEAFIKNKSEGTDQVTTE
jgi:acyl-CoA reductase-like NAD-dependent aldehyde dehydrogenase